MTTRISRAMVMAAGLGTRMRAFNDAVPKPLVQVAGKTLLDHSLDRLVTAGVEKAVVNVHHKPEMITAHLQARRQPQIWISDETQSLLDTGGGVARALPQLGDDPFFVLNTDALWLEGPTPALAMMAARFDLSQMDCLMLLAPMVTSLGVAGMGDFTMDPQGRLTRRRREMVAPFIFAGVCLVHPNLFAQAPSSPRYSMNVLWDQALDQGRLFGIVHEGIWMHVGDRQGVAEAEKLMTGK
ncbi:MAG: nucleotidyltransferase family protein [Alphaproteobacteria bacterium]